MWSLPGHSRQANKGHSPRCHRRPNGPGRLADKVVQPTTQSAEGCTWGLGPRLVLVHLERSGRGEWEWFGRQDSPGNSNISKMHKDRNASFNVHFQPRPMHVSSHNVFGLISSFSCHSTFSFFGICGVIFQSANRAADDFKTYQFVLPLDQGCFRMIQSCEDTDIRYEICLLINYLFTVPMERLGSFRAVRGGDGSDV